MIYAKWLFFLTSALLFSLQGLAGETSHPTLDGVAEVVKQETVIAKAEGRILTVEDALQKIGSVYPELRRNFILIHDSKSRQKASYEFPRVLVFTDDARFALTFNGDPQAPGYHELEMYEFSELETDGSLADVVEQSRRLKKEAGEGSSEEHTYEAEGFRFRRIVFEPSVDYPHAQSYANMGTFPVIRPVNEPLCLGCHGKNPRPNWESYNLWEGTYFRDDHRRYGEKYALDENGSEHDGFDLFYTKQANNGRYAFLQGVEERYLNPAVNRSRIPASQFTQVASYLNYRRIAHTIFQSPDYETYRFAILGAVYDCENFESFLPKAIHTNMERPLDQYIADTKTLFEHDPSRYFLTQQVGSMAKLRYVFEGRGISMWKWSMSFRRSQYSFVTPGGLPSGFISSLMMELDPTLEPYRAHRIAYGSNYFVTTYFTKDWTGNLSTMVAEECQAMQVKSCEAFARDKGMQCGL